MRIINNLIKMADSEDSLVEQDSKDDSLRDVEDDEDNLEDDESTTTTSEETRKYKSQVWNFLPRRIRSPSFVYFTASLAYHGGTSSMLQHLSRKHPAKKIAKISDEHKQTSLDGFTWKRTCSNKWAAAISDRIASFIVKDLRPIDLVAGRGFKNLITYLEPGYHLPTAT